MYIQVLAQLIAAGLAMLLITIWTLALLNGHQVTVYINNYNEAVPELALLIIIVPVIIYGTIISAKRLVGREA